MSKKITRKSYKRNKLVLGASLFAGVALVSTGFAAWVISSAATKEAEGNVEVGKVSDVSLAITLDTMSPDYFAFEPVAAPSGKTYIIQNDSASKAENLSVLVSGKVTGTNVMTNMTFKMGKHAGVDKAVAKNYIVAPTKGYATEEKYLTSNVTTSDPSAEALKTFDGLYTKEADKTSDNGTHYFQQHFTFAWGTEFKGVNPAQYYTECYTFIKNGAAGDNEVVKENSDLPTELQSASASDVQTYAEKVLVDLRRMLANLDDTAEKAAVDAAEIAKYKITVTANVD